MPKNAENIFFNKFRVISKMFSKHKLGPDSPTTWYFDT